MNPNYLDFEQPIAELEVKIEELTNVSSEADMDISQEIETLKQKSKRLTEKIFSNLSPWDVVRIARHPLRPHAIDYINEIFSEFDELHGDRHFGDDKAIIGGFGKFRGKSVLVIGHEKGHDTSSRIEHNFGMPRPEGYRKAQRLMKLAEQFDVPVISFVDTPGAYPGVGAEQRLSLIHI